MFDFLSWLPLIEDLLQIAAPIVQAHTTGKANQIAGVVDQATVALQNVTTTLGVNASPQAQQVESAVNTIAPMAEALVQQFTTASGHTITIAGPVSK